MRFRPATFAWVVACMIGCLGCRAAIAEPVPLLAEVLLAVKLNGVDTGDTALLLKDPAGHLLVKASDLERWRLLRPGSQPVEQGGEVFFRFDDVPGFSYRIDEAHQALALSAEPALFDSTRLDLAHGGRPVVSPVTPGLFLNYDATSSRSAGQQQNGALMELGAFHPLGAGTTSLALRQGYADGPHALRLESTWTHDLPEQRASLRLGDIVGRAGQWGRAARLGGLQWTTDFDTQPGYVPFPMPSLSGQAALPSTVDLYVDGALQLHRDVPAGPFTLDQTPLVTGQGEAQMVVRDLLGREQVIVTPYFATPRLLRAGLHDFSYEAGWLRNDFGIASDHYGRPAFAATQRLGIDDHLTVEGRVEDVGTQQAGGVGAVLALPGFGTVDATLAASRDEDGGFGALLGGGVQHQTRRFSYGATAQWTSAVFTQMGQQAGQPAVRENLQAYASWSTGSGAFSLSYLVQEARDKDAVRLLSGGYSIGLGSLGYLSVSLLRSSNPQGRIAANLTFTRALDARTSLSSTATAQSGGAQAQVQLQHGLPAGDGFGWRLRAADGAAPRIDAGASLQRDTGLASLDVSLAGAQSSARVEASGGFVWLDGSVHASRSIDSSFAVVEVPGQADVGVYVDNQLTAHTDATGTALLPRLRPYQNNPVRIELADLPLETHIDSLQLDAVPAPRSGMVLRFPIWRSRSATLKVMREDGSAVPAGAVAQLHGQPREFPFGTGGRLFLEGLGDTDIVDVQDPGPPAGKPCTFELTMPAGNDPVPDLGVKTCRVGAP